MPPANIQSSMPSYTGCDTGCLTEYQRLVNTVNSMAELLASTMPDCPALEKLETCCANSLMQGQLSQILAELIACLSESAGSGGILCGTSDPTDPPGVDCAKYYRIDTGEEWNWNATTSSWDKILS